MEANEKYTTKRYTNVHIAFTIQKSLERVYTHENLLVAYFSINVRFCLVTFGNPTFSNISPRARHVLMTFKSWTLCARLCIFSLYISLFARSSQQASIAMWTILISKSWMMVTETETLTSILHHNIFTYFGLCFFFCYLHNSVYIVCKWVIVTISTLSLLAITLIRSFRLHLVSAQGW